jgi:flagellar hook-associated protein 3 FlgL
MQISSLSQSTAMKNGISQLQTQLADLQRQLTTGYKTDSHAGLGGSTSLVLALNNQLTQSTNHINTIDATQLRLDVTSSALERLGNIASTLQTGGLTSDFQLVGSDQTSLQKTAGMTLEEIVSLLNESVADRQLFGGKDTQTPPVVSTDLMLNGDTTHAGLRQLVSERAQADLGADGRGRLALSSPASGTVALTENTGVFGFKLDTISSTLTGTTVNAPSGTPPALSVVFSSTLPNPGQSVSLDLTLPDGTSTTVTLTATSSNPPAAGQFTIGADAATTATNFSAALDTAIQREAKTSLTAASAVQASNEYFDYDASNPPQRVDGPPFNTATGLRDATASDTVFWYQGDNSEAAGDNFIATIGNGQQIAYGARADQSAIRTVVRNAALLTAVTYGDTTSESSASYTALTSRTSSALNFEGVQSVKDIVTGLGLKSANLELAKNNLETSIATSKGLLDDTQNADSYEVATKLSTLMTQLQSSYQITASLAKLSLTNYL